MVGSDPPTLQVNDCGSPESLSCSFSGLGSSMTAGSVGRSESYHYKLRCIEYTRIGYDRKYCEECVVGYSVEPANLIQRIGWLVRTLPVVRKKPGQSDVVEPSSLLAITLK